jgi:hypothetical protein
MSRARLAAGFCLLFSVPACDDGPTRPVAPPVLVAGPAPRVVPLGSAWTFSVTAQGERLTYQWRRNGAPIPGASGAIWVFRPGSLSEGGSLDVVVRNASGSVTSEPVDVRVVSAQGPWNRDLLIAASASAEGWTGFTTFVERAGVPSAARLPSGRLVATFQWFPLDDPVAFDRVAASFSDDGGRTWSPPRALVFTGIPQGYQRPFDPTVTVTAAGRIRLYFTSSPPATGTGFATGFYSAISDDGLTYAFEPGLRFHPGRSTVDCAAVLWNGMWHLLSPVGAPQEGAYHAVSDDGLSFTRASDLPSDGQMNWTGNLVAHGSTLRFYGTSGRGVWYATSPDGFAWSAPAFAGVQGGDPAVVPAEAGRWLIIVTGPDRPPGG